MDTLVTKLRRIPLLDNLEEELLTRLASSMTWREVRKGAQVLHKGSAGDHLLFLIRGRLQVLDVTESGQEIGLNLLTTGDHFGELSVIDGGARSASVIAMATSEIALLPAPLAWELFHKQPLVAQRILTGLAQKLRNASIYQTILCLPNASRRIHALLQRLSKEGMGGIVVIDHPPKQRELAIIANTSRETVSRTMGDLLSRGILEKDNSRLIVRKPDLLAKMAALDMLGVVVRPR